MADLGISFLRRRYLIPSVKSQKGAFNIQRCSVENQKGAIDVYKVYGNSALLVLNRTFLNSDSALLALT